MIWQILTIVASSFLCGYSIAKIISLHQEIKALEALIDDEKKRK